MKSSLESLNLSSDELSALMRQGFVAAEQRGSRTLYKLRFRFRGRQRVRSLGSDFQRAEDIINELQVLRAARRRELIAKRLVRQVNRQLKVTRRVLEPALAKEGYHYHGHAIRRSRFAEARVH